MRADEKKTVEKGHMAWIGYSRSRQTWTHTLHLHTVQGTPDDALFPTTNTLKPRPRLLMSWFRFLPLPLWLFWWHNNLRGWRKREKSSGIYACRSVKVLDPCLHFGRQKMSTQCCPFTGAVRRVGTWRHLRLPRSIIGQRSQRQIAFSISWTRQEPRGLVGSSVISDPEVPGSNFTMFNSLFPISGTFCKTKIAIFVKAQGRGAKKMAHVREYPHESSCGRPSSRTNFSFRDRTFVRWIQWFSWFGAVVRLVLSVQLDLPAFFFFYHRDLDFGDVQLINVWTLVSGMHDGFLNLAAAVDGHRFCSNWQWTWFCVCGLNRKSSAPTLLRRCHRLHERAVGEERSAKIFHHHRTRNHPKELIPNSANYEARFPDRPVKTSHSTCRHCHDQQSDRTETSIFCLQNDATVRRTVTTFVCPQTQFHENLHTNFALQNLPILSLFFSKWGQWKISKSFTCTMMASTHVRQSSEVYKNLPAGYYRI